MKKFILLLFVLLFTVFISQPYAQLKDNYIKGRIILTDGKEFDGYIKQLDLEKINKKVFYKSSLEDKQQTIYLSSDVKRISLENGAVYDLLNSTIPKTDNKVSLLSSLLLKGKASLYESSYNGINIYLIENNGVTYWLQDDELKDMEIVRYYYKNILLLALEGISDNKPIDINFDKESFLEYVNKYNKASGSESEIIDVKKKATSFIIAGIGGMYKNDSENQFYLNAIHRTYFPTISQNTSINFGFSYFKKIYQENTSNNGKMDLIRNLYSIPFSMQQNFISKSVRPYLFVGCNLSYIKEETRDGGISVIEKGIQKNFGLGLLFGGGIEADISKRILAKAEYRYENFPHLIMLGFAYKFNLNGHEN